jgi:hypothetical protein
MFCPCIQAGSTALSFVEARLRGLGTQEQALATPLWECNKLLMLA